MPSKRHRHETTYNTSPRKSSNRSIVSHGSKIDKLYYDKYLPLRERKLLDKLVRTRAVYDDIRNRILTKSKSDVKRFKDDKEYDNIQYIIERVDRGDLPPLRPNVHGKNCNCCSCRSATVISKQSGVSLHIPSRDNVNENLPDQNAEQRKRKVRYRSVESDPCTCAYKFKNKQDDNNIQPTYKEEYQYDEINHDDVHYNSSTKLEIEPEITPIEDTEFESEAESEFDSQAASEVPLEVKSEEKIKTKPKVAKNHQCKCIIKDITPKDEIKQKRKIAKNHQCKCIKTSTSSSEKKNKIKLARQKSSEKIHSAANKIRQSIRSSITAIENVFQIKKDSLAIYRDKLKKKKDIKAWTCDFNSCKPHECISVECYEKIKTRGQKKKPSVETEKPIVVFARSSKKNIKKTKYPKSKQGSTPSTCICEPTASVTAVPIRYASRRNVAKMKQSHSPQLMQMHDPRLSSCSPQKCLKILLRKSPADHRLERCFCTLQISKPPKGQQSSHSPPRSIAKLNSPVLKTSPKKRLQRNLVQSKTGIKSTRAKRKNVKCECPKDFQKTSTLSTNIKRNEKQSEKAAISPVLLHDPYFRPHGLFPYECKPSSCIPSSCDPYICKEQIKKRDLIPISSLTKNLNTILPPIKTKITSFSVTQSPPSPESIKVRKPKHRNQQLKPVKMEAPYAAKSKSSPSAPNRQVLRIGSSFRFDIEFYKNLPEHTENAKRDNIKNFELKHPKPKESKSVTKPYHAESYRKIQSKYPDESILEPFLKKCFCSFKSNKYGKQKPFSPSSTKMTTIRDKKHNYPAVSKSSMTTAVVNYVMPNYSKLLPYECEPKFCTPGQCNPNECLKRIQMRNSGRSREAGTMSTSPGRTSSTSTYCGSRSTSAMTPKRHRLHKKIQGNSSTTGVSTNINRMQVIDKSKSSPSAIKRNKSAVKIGSTFSFNVEFYKDKSDAADAQEKVTRNREQRPKVVVDDIPIEKETKTQQKQVTAKINKPRLSTRRVGRRKKYHNEMSQVNKNVDSKNVATDNFLKRCFCTLKLQQNVQTKMKEKKINTPTASRYSNITEIKAIATQTRRAKPPPAATTDLLPYECEPNFCTPGQCNPVVCLERIKKRNLLKRCFCTLKFQAQTKPFPMDPPPLRRSIGTETIKQKQIHEANKYDHKLLDYECEPGVCVPGSCDPHECLKLINKRNRNTHDAKLQTKHPRKRSEFSTTRTNTRDEAHLVNKQKRDKGSSKEKRKMKDSSSIASKFIKAPRREMKTKEIADYSSSGKSHASRQSVKLGSQISFEIEFFKRNSQEAEPSSKPVSETHVVVPKQKQKKYKDSYNSPQGFRISRDRGHAAKGFTTHDSQVGDIAHKANKSSFTDSKLERCFCTLKLQKRGNLQNQHQYCVFTSHLRPNLQAPMQPLESQSLLDARECRASLCLQNNIDIF